VFYNIFQGELNRRRTVVIVPLLALQDRKRQLA